jgi:hypothetical protein
VHLCWCGVRCGWVRPCRLPSAHAGPGRWGGPRGGTPPRSPAGPAPACSTRQAHTTPHQTTPHHTTPICRPATPRAASDARGSMAHHRGCRGSGVAGCERRPPSPHGTS